MQDFRCHSDNRAVWAVIVTLVLCGGAVSCTQTEPEGTPQWSTSQRLIVEDPEESFDLPSIIDGDPVISWNFADQAAASEWTVNLSDEEISVSRDGLRIEPRRRYVVVSRDIELDTSAIDSFEVIIRGMPRQTIGVQWPAGQGVPPEERQVEAGLGSRLENNARSYRMVTRGHPHWQAGIRRISFYFIVPENQTMILSSIRAIEETVNEHDLLEALSIQWKIELGGDLRSAVLIPPGQPAEFTATIPGHARLNFAFGAPTESAAGLVFTLTASDGRSTEELFSAPGSPRGWTDASIDLSPFAGREITFNMSTEGAEFVPAAGLPAWANPEVATAVTTKRPNILLISVDTLRPDHLGAYGYERNTSPNIDTWAQTRGTVFEDAVAAAPWTLPSHISMLTGLDSDHHGLNFNVGADQSVTFLAELLREANYTTAAITGGGYLHPQYGFAQGFDRYRASGVAIGNERELEVGVDHALAFLDSHSDRPWLLFFHTYEVHNPYRARSPLADELELDRDAFVDAEVGKAVAEDGFLARRGMRLIKDGQEVEIDAETLSTRAVELYDCGISYTDELIGRLLLRLEELDLADDTIVVLTSDHGELFGEHGVVNHISVYDENVSVPLIISAPKGLGAGLRIPAQVRSVDIVPTILDLVGQPIPENVDGQSLVAFLNGERQPDLGTGEAWSMATASNYGVSLRDQGRFHYAFKNGAWRSPGVREELFLRDPASGVFLPAAGEDSEILRLRTRARARMETRVGGLRVQIDGRGSLDPVKGSLFGPMVQENKAKVLDADSAILDRCAANTACFTIQPEDHHTYIFEGVIRGNLTLRLETGCRAQPSFEAVVTATMAREGWSVSCLKEGWVVGAIGHAAKSHHGDVTVWSIGNQSSTSNSAVDEALLQQLEALGYVTSDE